jgi:hypothetical protein
VSEELEVLKIVTSRLATGGIPYMVTGSIAVNYYAVPRMTRDIDVVVELSPRDTDRICSIFQNDFYIDREAVQRSIEEKGMFNIIHSALVIKVDFVVRKGSDYRREEFSRKRRVTVEGHDLFMVAPEDLIISKDQPPGSATPLPRGQWMNDTDPEVEQKFVAMLMERSGEERLKMGCSMHSTAQALVRASVLEKDPLASPAALRRALFLRFYGHEFDAETREKILLLLEGVRR